MTADPTAASLVKRLAELSWRQMTGAHHLAQIVTEEHRGHCTHASCTPACQEVRALLIEAAEYVDEAERTEEASRMVQEELFV